MVVGNCGSRLPSGVGSPYWGRIWRGKVLAKAAAIAKPETILRWPPELVANKDDGGK